MATIKKDSISIETLEKKEDGNVIVKLTVRFTGTFKKEESGLYTFYIPAIDVCYTANSEDEGRRIGKSATSAFLGYWGEERSKFMMRIRVLGFVPSNGVWQTVMKKQRYQNSDFTFKDVSAKKKLDILLNRYHDTVEVALHQ